MRTDGRTAELVVDGRGPLSSEVVAELADFCDRVEQTNRPAVITVAGAPAEPRIAGTALTTRWERMLRRLERLRVPVIAVASGDCGGLALEALLTADYRLATPDLRLLATDGEAGPVWPGMALYRLANQVGATRVRVAVLFGAPVTTADALAWGVIDRLVSDLPTGVRAARHLATTGDPSLPVRRQLLQEATTATFEDALGRHLAACDRLDRQR